MANKTLLAIGPFILNAGAVLLLFFVVLAGVTEHNPLNKIYYLQADTSGIPGAPPESRWTLWNRCAVQDGLSVDCTDNHPAYGFQPAVNFGTRTGVPQDLLDNRSRDYYLSRFGFSFTLMALIFSSFAFLVSWFALCSRALAGCTSVLTFSALVTAIIAASLYTALGVYARDGFTSAGNNASIGVKFFAFIWTAVACLLLASIGFVLACTLGRDRRGSRGVVQPPPPPGAEFNEKRGRRRFFSRRNDALADGESQRRVISNTERSSF
ncbi:SUR7/PalI family-domain-containing protein [Lipomyces japonicus]|uniref:SUR7/PalI family-domain-containing protein n=1 Tax=Lipomyces japonicus TaxID=56871 RepID=UPI0034CE92D1